MKCQTVILAAGDGKRMNSHIPKVLHKICGRELISWAYSAAKEVSDGEVIIVCGENKQAIEELLPARYAEQTERKGTAHAVMCAEKFIKREGLVIVTAGDMPLIKAETFAELISKTEQENLSVCVLCATADDPTGYGRIVRNKDGSVEKIVEQKDATSEEKKIKEINTSVYCFKTEDLLDSLKQINCDNAQGEYYLTDTVKILNRAGKKVGALVLDDNIQALGVNDRVQLAMAQKQMQRRINEEIMRSGVTMIDPETTYIDACVRIGKDAVIYPSNLITGETEISSGAVIYPGCRIDNSSIGKETTVTSSVMLSASVGDNCSVGPNAYLRPGTVVGNNARIGDFVEIKNAVIGDGTKVSHLTYVGDATVGKDCNMGCGTVFVNYDGKNKHHTNVGDHVFIGCNSNLIAPLDIADNTLIAAATTVTENMEKDDMCIGRCRQENKKGWVRKYKNW